MLPLQNCFYDFKVPVDERLHICQAPVQGRMISWDIQQIWANLKFEKVDILLQGIWKPFSLQ